MSVLTGHAIKQAYELGDLVIDPWEPSHLHHEDRINSASYDLRLGSTIAVYEDTVDFYKHTPLIKGAELCPKEDGFLDVRKENKVLKFEMTDSGFLLKPKIGYLLHTAERISSKKYVPIIEGKSSLGRLFVTAHVTAGYGDAGFDGQFTLEVTVTHPVIIVPGMLFCQVRFLTQLGELKDYKEKGNYKDELAKGPVPSMVHKQFR